MSRRGIVVVATLAGAVAVLIDALGRRPGRTFIVAVISLDLLVVAIVAALVACLWPPTRERSARLALLGGLGCWSVALLARLANGQLQPATVELLALESLGVMAIAFAGWVWRDELRAAGVPMLLRTVGSVSAVTAIVVTALPADGAVVEARTYESTALVLLGAVLLAAAPRDPRSVVARVGAVVAVVLRIATGGDAQPVAWWSAPLAVAILGAWTAPGTWAAVAERTAQLLRSGGAAVVAGGRRARAAVSSRRRPARPRPAPAPLHTLRELDRRQRWLVATLATATIAAVAFSAAWARHQGWYPIGDDAILASRAADVGGSRTSLLGMPSTLGPAGPEGLQLHHPGPLLIWWYSPFVHVLGPWNGVMAGASALALVGIGLTVWAALRARGLSVALWAWFVAFVVALSAGAGAPFEPLNAYAPLLPLLAALMLSWAAASGVRSALPFAVVMASLCVQAYLPTGPVPAAAVIVAAACVVVPRWRPVGTGPSPGRTLAWTTAVGVLAWAGPLAEAAANRGGNLRLLSSVSESNTTTIGGGGSWRALLRLSSLPPSWVRTYDFRVDDATSLLTGGNVTGLIFLGFALWMCWTRWSRWDVGLRRLAVLAGIAGFVACLTVSRTPRTFVFAYQVGWLSVVAAFGAFSFVVLARSLITGPLRLAGRTLPPWAPPSILSAATLALAVALAWPGPLTSYSSVAAWTQSTSEALAADLGPGPAEGRPVAVLTDGRSWEQVIANSLTMSLIAHGRDARVTPLLGEHWGRGRAEPVGPRDPVLIVSDGFSPGTPPSAQLVARVEPDGWSSEAAERTAASVAAWARDRGAIVVRPGFDGLVAPAVLAWDVDQPCRALEEALSGNRVVSDLPDGAIAQLYLEGVVARPLLPEGLRRRLEHDLLATPTEVWLTDGSAATPGAAGPTSPQCP